MLGQNMEQSDKKNFIICISRPPFKYNGMAVIEQF